MGKRKLPTYAWESGELLTNIIVVASNPESPSLKRNFAAGTDAASGITTLVAVVVAAASVPLMLRLCPPAQGDGWAGYAMLVGAAAAVLTRIGTWLWLRHSHREHALCVDGAWHSDRRRSRGAMSQLVEDRRTLREIARGPVGARVSDAVLFDVERVTWEASQAACAVDVANARAEAVPGSGPEAESLRDRFYGEAEVEADRVDRYAAAVHEVTEAAAEMDAAFRLLQAAGLDLWASVDGTELYLTGELADAARVLRSQADAAREVCTAAGAPALEVART